MAPPAVRSYSRAAQIQTLSTPEGFVCAHSRSVMEDPVIHLTCARLFDSAVTKRLPKCPFDQGSFDDGSVLELAELKKRIQKWKNPPVSSAAGAARSLSPETSAAAEALGSLSLEASSAVGAAHGLSPEMSTQAKPEVSWRVQNAHLDDIHGLALYNKGVVSCSKDGAVRQWSSKGEALGDYNSIGDIDYRRWVTAIGTHPRNSLLLTGTRDGYLSAYSPSGKLLNPRPWHLRPSVHTEHKSKHRNINRIACLTLLPEDNYVTPFFVGIGPTLNLASVDNTRRNGWFTKHSTTQVHANDWVYCIKPLTKENPLGDLLVVIGSRMSQWHRNPSKDPYKESAWDKETFLVKEDRSEVGRREGQTLRPHIASIVSSPTQASHITYACFENNRGFGPIRIVDIAKRVIVFNAEEHKGRSWTVDYVSPHVFASGADDATVKLWDPRYSRKSIQTLPKHVGRVSAVTSPAENILLTASCPDDIRRSTTKAELTCWDLRMPKEML